jgi:DNA processing protein
MLSASDEIRALVAMSLVSGLGPRLTAAILDRFGSASAARRARPEELDDVPRLGSKLARDFHTAMATADVDGELALAESHRVELLAYTDDRYPQALSTIPDRPHLLYCRGQLEAHDSNAVAIVGSRHGTAYGRRVAERLASALARAGFTIVSGLARGIDGAAHRGALTSGRTIAVLAGGLRRIYPPEHAELAMEIERSGALLTESTMAMQPLAEMFPARNRIISGLCRGIIVVEAAERSGALITARHAAEQGRAVFAVPGPVDSPASAGTLKLIRDGATLVRGAEDVIEELDGVAPIVSPAADTPAPSLTLDDRQLRVWAAISEPKHIDELSRQLSLPTSELAGLLLGLEMKKAIRRLPGSRFERV